MIDLTSAVPPHDEAAEAGVVASCLMDGYAEKRAAWTAVEVVRPEHFYVWKHRAVFTTIAWLTAERSEVDVETVAAALKDAGRLDEIGGREALMALLNETEPSPANVRVYAERVRAKARLRALGTVGAEIAKAAYLTPDTAEADRAASAGAAKLIRLMEDKSRSTCRTIQALALAEAVRQEAPPEVAVGLSTGLVDVDSIVGGLRPEELLIVAARPSMGKTAFATGIIRHVVTSHPPRRVLFFSLEVSAEQITRNMMAQMTGADSRHIDSATLSVGDRARIMRAAQELHERAPLVIDDGSGLDSLRVRARAAASEGVALIVVDYLQLMAEPREGRDDNRSLSVGRAAIGLKRIARDLRIPIVALAQLNRAVESRAGNKPMLSDLRESGEIEQHADVVMLLHREEYYQRDKADAKGKASVIVAKNRNGAVGEATVRFVPHCVRFENWSWS